MFKFANEEINIYLNFEKEKLRISKKINSKCTLLNEESKIK